MRLPGATHLEHFVGADGGFAARSRGVFFDAGDAGLDKAVPPARDQLAPDGHLCGDWLILPTVGGEQDNLGSQREATRRPRAYPFNCLGWVSVSVTRGAVRISSSYQMKTLRTTYK